MSMPRPLPDDDESHPPEPGLGPETPKEPGPAPGPKEVVPDDKPSQDPDPNGGA
jgi:hypothetical protein